ncbi:MAG: type II secretion system minor pseudopilin GspK [Sphingobium sp.]|nr:type II secretion system minor pseudopilin GspK [Sphingobium sp.]
MAFDRESEVGAALLTVLLLVAILAVIAAIALERLTLASRMTRNIVSSDQGRAYLLAAEQIAGRRIEDMLAQRADRTTLAGDWLGTPQVMTVPGGAVTAVVRDSGNCFNLNSLVEPVPLEPGVTGPNPLGSRPLGISQFSGLMRLLGVDRATADQVAVSAADWIDSDSKPAPGGAEDEFYAGLKPSYRPANNLMADPSELRMVNAVTPQLYERIRPWICTLPTTDLSPINVNTLLPEQGALIAMFAPDKLGVEQTRQLLAQRPADGYGSLPDFWEQGQLSQLGLPELVTQQVKQKSRWFEVLFSIDLGGDKVEETVLYDAGTHPARVVRRQWSGNGE